MNFFRLKSILVSGWLFFGLGLFLPKAALAATAYLGSDFESVAVGDTVAVSVYLDSEGQYPNTVEGQMVIDPGSEKIEILEISKAGSVLTHWPQSPSLDNSSLITFTGGTPGGFNQSAGLLFKIVFKAKQEGQVKFMPTGFKAYNNDQTSTSINVSASSFTINIVSKTGLSPQDQWLEIISNDNTPPSDLSAIIGQDSALFDGKKFMTIFAKDDQSGLDYFEVKEGDLAAARTGQTYVLLDQTESVPIIISAYDKAGNVSRTLLTPTVKMQSAGYQIWLSWIALIAVVAVVVFIIFSIIKKKKNKKNKFAQ